VFSSALEAFEHVCDAETSGSTSPTVARDLAALSAHLPSEDNGEVADPAPGIPKGIVIASKYRVEQRIGQARGSWTCGIPRSRCVEGRCAERARQERLG